MFKSSGLTSLPAGYLSYHTSCGIKDNSLDLGVVVSEKPASCAAIFTQNVFPGEPIKIGRKHIQDGTLQAVVVNSKNANVLTGLSGYEKSMKICEKVADELGIVKELVLPSSTGVIGRPLPLEKVLTALDGLKGNLSKPADFAGFANAIMTTDTKPKVVSAKVGNASIVGVAKGAGMIEPNMATMLSYFFTDAQVSSSDLGRMLKSCADKSFNCLSIDSDTSTSDTVAILANGLAGPVDLRAFEEALEMLCVDLVKMIARDGEGATKLFLVDIINAESVEVARKVGKSIINSPLVKTMIYQGDPNWGRIFMAIGKTPGLVAVKDSVKIFWGKDRLIDQNSASEDLSGYLKENEEINLIIDMGNGSESCRVYGCDLTEEYVKINAYYTT